MRSSLGRIVVAVALVEVIVAIGILVIGALSSGYALSPGLVSGLLLAGLVVGIAIGVMASARGDGTATSAVARPGASHALPGSHALAGPRSPGAAVPAAGLAVLSRLGAVAAGTATALVLAILVNMAAGPWRGPIVGVWELGTPRYAKPQKPIDLAVGVVVLTIALAIAMVIVRVVRHRGIARWFGGGLLVSGALLALGIVTR